MKRVILLLIVMLWPTQVMAQSQFGNQKVQSGTTCPPVTAPLSGDGTLYTCTGTGALYNWLGASWNLVSTGTSDIGGAIAITQVAVGSGADTISGSADLTSSGGADLTIGQESAIPAAFQNWWPESALNVFNNDRLLPGVQIVSRGINNDLTFGSALNVLSFADAATEFANGVWISSWKHSALAQPGIFGLYVDNLTSVDATTSTVIESIIDVGLFPSPGVTIGTAYNYRASRVLYGTLTTGYGFKDSAFILGGAGGAELIGTWYSFHADELDPAHITNPHYLWFNSDGVLDIREASSQAIVGLHNPGFTKYTTGLANYERIVTQWESNVAVITTENGGTGTLRAMRLGDTGVSVTFGSSATSPLYISSGSGMTVANVGANSCGTSAATIAGGSNSFEVTVGATSGTQCRVAFPTAAPNRWNCVPTNTVTANLVRAASIDTTHVDLLGVFVAGDVIAATCLPR